MRFENRLSRNSIKNFSLLGDIKALGRGEDLDKDNLLPNDLFGNMYDHMGTG